MVAIKPSILPVYLPDLVTRRMCATAHLDAEFAREVIEEYAEDGLNAVGPALGVNLVAVVRHARLAEERGIARDRKLAALLGLLLALLVSGGALLATGNGTLGLACLAASATVLPGAWLVVFRNGWAARSMALALRDDLSPPQSLAPPLPAQLERRLDDLKRVNIIPYHADAEARTPFVGSGWRISESVWAPVDVSRPAKGPAGQILKPVPFDVCDLHHHLAQRLPGVTGLGNLKADSRLYVRGLHVVDLGPEVLPDPLRQPLAVIPDALVQEGADKPGGGMETYLSLRAFSGGGKVVVSVHLRAQLHWPQLSWEVAAYVLPPLGERFDEPPWLAGTRARLKARTAAHAVHATSEALLRSWSRLGRRSWHRALRRRRLTRLRKEIRKDYGRYDYGARSSLREQASAWSRMGYSELRDAQIYFKSIVQATLTCTESFLTEHHIDASDLRSQRQQIIREQVFNFNGVIHGGVQAGSENQMTVNGPVPPPGGGTGAGGPSPEGGPPAPGN
ncbi:hypothetical protein AB0L99_28220 [Streptomyces sp. NPDC051954]|uniref:hypothetical protein n=1 Tax=Streptomyces sp. NPDC051954 TaxID=3155524 RepID=UPI003415B94A